MDFAAVAIGVYRGGTAMSLYFSDMAGVFGGGSNHFIRIENRDVWNIVLYCLHSPAMPVLHSGALSIFEISL